MTVHTSSVTPRSVLAAWKAILSGCVPMLSIEITRECPLHCPGCYAYGDGHLGGGITLRQLSDLRGDDLVDGVLDLVRLHRPMHVSLVGGEPLIRHRELGKILLSLDAMGVYTLVVTSGVLPIPLQWMGIPHALIAISVDGLPEHHDVRRKPATYRRILENIEGRRVNVHWVITRPMLARSGYCEDYLAFWNGRPEVNRIWVSLYSPQTGEQSPERLTDDDRRTVARELPALSRRFPKLLISEGIVRAFLHPPASPDRCLFAKMSTNYSADLKAPIEPCVLGGSPDCSQCGCAISSTLHWIQGARLAGPIKVGHLVDVSVGVGRIANYLKSRPTQLPRWRARFAGRDAHLAQFRE